MFRVFGITVWLHWSWFLILAWRLQLAKNSSDSPGSTYYNSPVWMVAELIAVFGIVLLHEFGHALACKQTGGEADTIVLWPLGGIAYVRTPNRPGATLWSLAAGPLVNVVLVPVTLGAFILAGLIWPHGENTGLLQFLKMVMDINLIILCFNMLPIYPLDGGQILRSLLWFVIGPVRSLYTAVVIGFLGAVAMVGVAFLGHNPWFGVLAIFAASRCWAGFQQAKVLGKIKAMPRHLDFKCPACGESPFIGAFWGCNQCRKPFDPFETGGQCPHCSHEFHTANCPLCHQLNPISSWRVGPPPL